MPTFTFNQLRDVSNKILVAAGVSREEADIIGDVLASTDLHGVIGQGFCSIPDLVEWALGNRTHDIRIDYNPGGSMKILRDTPNMALWDANGAFGYVAGKKAMETAIEKAKQNGVMGSVGFTNSSYTGSNFYYGMIALEHDMIGMVSSTGIADMVAYGGSSGVLGNNPMCVAIPAGEEYPIIVDMSTSLLSMGTMDMMTIRGERIPDGALLDKDGQPTNDFKALRQGGFFIPFGGHKGYGIAMILEALNGALTGFGCSHEREGFSVLMTAINIEQFQPIEKFKSIIDGLVRHVKASPPRAGFDEVRVPGEAKYNAKDRLSKDGIYIDDEIWHDVQKTAIDVGLNPETLL